MTATLHTLFVWKLSKELEKQYDNISTNVELHGKRRVLAEIDILAERNGEVHVYEVKKSHRPTKARQQCKKIKKHYERRISRFFLYSAEADQLLELTV